MFHLIVRMDYDAVKMEHVLRFSVFKNNTFFIHKNVI